jgi:hypothetical protein
MYAPTAAEPLVTQVLTDDTVRQFESAAVAFDNFDEAGSAQNAHNVQFQTAALHALVAQGAQQAPGHQATKVAPAAADGLAEEGASTDEPATPRRGAMLPVAGWAKMRRNVQAMSDRCADAAGHVV